MKKIRITLLILLVAGLYACENNEPVTYTSIKGSWRCTESFPTTRSYLVDIAKTKEGSTQYVIFNFHNSDYFNGSELIENSILINLQNNIISISQQAIGDRQIGVKSGSGKVNSTFTQIDCEYMIFDGASDIPVKVTFTR